MHCLYITSLSFYFDQLGFLNWFSCMLLCLQLLRGLWHPFDMLPQGGNGRRGRRAPTRLRVGAPEVGSSDQNPGGEVCTRAFAQRL